MKLKMQKKWLIVGVQMRDTKEQESGSADQGAQDEDQARQSGDFSTTASNV